MVKNKQYRNSGDEAPTLKQFLMVILITALLIAFFWVAYNKFGWFH
ncbi:MAG: hypothetical protein ACXWV1_07750 [Chitinophagaceae bacterium]